MSTRVGRQCAAHTVAGRCLNVAPYPDRYCIEHAGRANGETAGSRRREESAPRPDRGSRSELAVALRLSMGLEPPWPSAAATAPRDDRELAIRMLQGVAAGLLLAGLWTW